MTIYEDNARRCEEFLTRNLNFHLLKTSLLHNDIITIEQLISYSNFLQSPVNKDTGNNNVMSALVKLFFKSEKMLSLLIKILQDSGVYTNEAYQLTSFLECQKKNSGFFKRTIFTQQKFYFKEPQRKDIGDAQVTENINLPHANEQIDQQNSIIHQNNVAISEEDLCCYQEMGEVSLQTEATPSAPETNTFMLANSAFPSNQRMEHSVPVAPKQTIDNVGVDSLTSAFGQVNVTPMDQTDEMIAAVFHQVPDLEEYSDIGDADKYKVYEIAKKIGMPKKAMQGIQTHRIGKARKQFTRPLAVKFKNNKTRDAFLQKAKSKSEILDAVNIVPFASKEKRKSMKKDNHKKAPRFNNWFSN